MSATIEKNEVTEQAAAERLTADGPEHDLEQRTTRLELVNPLSVVFGLLALGVAVVALFFALSARSDHDAAVLDRVPTAPAPHGTNAPAMNGAGGMAMASTAAAKGKITVDLGDFWVRPSASTVRAGKVTFLAHNVGRVEHELMIERMPLKMDGPGTPNEDAAQGMIDDMQPGQRGRMTLKLTPGRYVLFCNVQGHYAAGQHLPFTVVES